VRIAPTADVVQTGDAHVHLPGQSYWPIVLAFGLPVVGYGIIYNLTLSFVGGAIILGAIYGWVMEPSMAGGHDDHGGGPEEPHEPEPETEAEAAEPAEAEPAADEPAAAEAAPEAEEAAVD
jgi:cytochrome c oxidase subunit 1